MPLKIAAKIANADQDYYEQEIKPLFADRARVHRRDRRSGQAGVPGQRGGAAVPRRLARAVRAGHDRGDGLRHAGDCLSMRLGPRGHAGRRVGVRRGLRRRGRGRGAAALGSRAPQCRAYFESASWPNGWRATTWPCSRACASLDAGSRWFSALRAAGAEVNVSGAGTAKTRASNGAPTPPVDLVTTPSPPRHDDDELLEHHDTFSSRRHPLVPTTAPASSSTATRSLSSIGSATCSRWVWASRGCTTTARASCRDWSCGSAAVARCCSARRSGRKRPAGGRSFQPGPQGPSGRAGAGARRAACVSQQVPLEGRLLRTAAHLELRPRARSRRRDVRLRRRLRRHLRGARLEAGAARPACRRAARGRPP